ncbi:MAG: hypothetical protein Q9157_008886, partial [Trypethelium eluteriae]
ALMLNVPRAILRVRHHAQHNLLGRPPRRHDRIVGVRLARVCPAAVELRVVPCDLVACQPVQLEVGEAGEVRQGGE